MEDFVQGMFEDFKDLFGRLFPKIASTPAGASIILEDNTGAIFLSRNKQVGARTKHIDVRYHFIREKVENGNILVQYVNTLKNPADLLSKNVTQKIHDSHAHKMLNGTMDCWNEESDKI